MPKHVGALYILCVRCAFIGVMNEYIVMLHGMKSVMKQGQHCHRNTVTDLLSYSH